MADAPISPYDYPELFDSSGRPLSQYREIFDWRVTPERRAELIRAAVEPIHQAQYKEYSQGWADELKIRDSVKVLDANYWELELARAKQAEEEAAQKLYIDAYNAKAAADARSAWPSMWQPMYDRLVGAQEAAAAKDAATPWAPDPAAQAAIDAANKAVLDKIRAPAAAGDVRARFKLEEERAAAQRAAMSRPVLAPPPAPQSAFSRALEHVLDVIHLRRRPRP